MDGSTVYANAYTRNNKCRNDIKMKDHEIKRCPKVYYIKKMRSNKPAKPCSVYE